MKNKIIKIGSGVMLGLTLLSTTAFGHCRMGQGYRHNGVGACGYGHRYALCHNTNCTLEGRHYHNGVYYYGHCQYGPYATK